MGAQPCRGLRGRPATHHRMSAHVKPRIATHFAYPLEPAKGLGASCGAGTAPADLTVTGLAKAAIRVFRARGLHAASGAGRQHSGSPRSEDLPSVALNTPTEAALRTSFIGPSLTLAKFPANSLLFVENS